MFCEKSHPNRLFMVLSIFVASIALSSCYQLHQQKLVQPQSLSQFLQQTDVVDIEQYGLDQKGVKVLGPGVVRLHKAENQKMFLLLKASNRFHHNSPHKPADLVFTMSVRNYTYEQEYDYIISTGELGSGSEWCYVPVAFKAWVKTLAKPVHAKYQVNTNGSVITVGPRK